MQAVMLVEHASSRDGPAKWQGKDQEILGRVINRVSLYCDNVARIGIYIHVC